MKFTDEQIERILTAHEGGQLKRLGSAWDENYCDAFREEPCSGCVNQVAYDDDLVRFASRAMDINPFAAHW